MSLDTHAWPQARLGELLSVLGRRAQLGARDVEPMPIADAVIAAGDASVGRWIEATCDWKSAQSAPGSRTFASRKFFSGMSTTPRLIMRT